jgi:hypothetical protein
MSNGLFVELLMNGANLFFASAQSSPQVSRDSVNCWTLRQARSTKAAGLALDVLPLDAQQNQSIGDIHMTHRMRFGIFLAPFHKPGINPTLAWN